LREGAGELLESIRLFDVYENAEQLGEGRKSLAYALRFRAADRTLTVDEASAARESAVALAGERTGAVLRACAHKGARVHPGLASEACAPPLLPPPGSPHSFG